jgi:O-antigen ligase
MCYTAAFPFAFTLLDMMAISKFDLNEFASNAWYAFFIVIGVWVMARNNLINLTKYAPKFVCALLFIYTLILTQIPLKTSSIVAPIQMYGINIIDARNLNSYNLAIYSAFALIVGIYFFVKSSNFLRFLLIGAVLILSNFILMTSWRPVWLALGLSALFIFVIIDRQKWFNLVIGMLAIQAILLASNFVNYGNRIYEIAKNINTEERLTIWKDAWRMQLTSQPREWLTGHGLNSFYSDFKAYSTYHSIHNFRSPHNVFLDLIYTSGMLGLVTVLCFYYFTYKYIFKALKFSKNNNILICTLLILLTTNLIFNGLNHAFFMRLNIFPIAFICAMLLYLKEHQWQSNTDYV